MHIDELLIGQLFNDAKQVVEIRVLKLIFKKFFFI